MSESSPRDVLLAKAIAYFASHGVGDTSLRTLAAGIGTSHRMLNYHFGSRDGLLAAVVDWMARRHLVDLEPTRRSGDAEPVTVAWNAWSRLADDAPVFAPLLFELSAHAMVGHPWAEQLRDLVAQGIELLASYFEALGHPPERAMVLGRTAMALSRGAVFDLALTGDRQAADAVMRGFLDWSLPVDNG